MVLVCARLPSHLPSYLTYEVILPVASKAIEQQVRDASLSAKYINEGFTGGFGMFVI